MEVPGEFVYHPGKAADAPGRFIFRRDRLPGWVVFIGRLGKFLIGAGLLVLAFVVYQLWGTNLQEARSQSRLRSQFEAKLAAAPKAPATVTSANSGTPAASSVATSTTSSTSSTSTTGASVTPPPATLTPSLATLTPSLATVVGTAFKEGEQMARIEIPRIGVDKIVVSGVSREDLKKGPGHYPDTAQPGQLGNAAIAGHRTTFGAPFNRINELGAGDHIKITTLAGVYDYIVSGDPMVVSPNDFKVLDPTDTATLTLTSCHPKYSARQRIVVKAALDVPHSSTPTPAATATATSPTSVATSSGSTPGSSLESAPETDPATVTTITRPSRAAQELRAGWFSEPGAWPPTIVFAMLCFGFGLTAWYVGRRWRRWPSYGLAVIPFLLALYFFFENFTRLLPPNI